MPVVYRAPARLVALTVALVTGLAVSGCTASAPTPGVGSASTLSGEVTVFAAASLQGAFDEIAAQFESENPGVQIAPISYDGSSTLATQLVEGAPADVFASANEKNMQVVTDAGLTVDPQLFATNTLVIAVPAGNPAGVTDLADLASPDLTVVLCAPDVPCGSASQTLLDNAGLSVTPASLEQNVTAVVTKLAAGEADAGLVYATDVTGRTDLEAIVPAGADAVINRYPISALTGAASPDAAAAFVAFVVGPRGQEVLARFGFGAP